MAPFYAYAIQTDAIVATGCFQGFVMTFADRDAADEWWRGIVAAKTAITRITAQHYEYQTTSILNSKDFRSNVFFTLLPGDRLFVIPDANIRDHVNGQTYFIRCKREPTIYWFVDAKGRIRASDNERAKFKISIQGDDTADDTTIMIGSDTVGITVAGPIAGSSAACSCNCCDSCNCCNSEPGSVCTNSNGELVIGSTLLAFSFSDFKSGFEIQCIATLNDSASSTAIVKSTDGEEWELV